MIFLLRFVAGVLFGVLTLGGVAYYLLAICSVRRFVKLHARQPEEPGSLPSISLLKPLCGADPNLENNLETFFLQDYPEHEILFAVREEADPAVAIARRVMARHPEVPSSLQVVGDSPYANAKVFSMEKMEDTARHGILVITDSDVSVRPDYLKSVAAAFADSLAGAMTNLYRGVESGDFWSKLEALGMSTEFMAGVVVAERLEGMRFTLGPSMAITRDCLKSIGGFRTLADYLADDFVLGEKAFQSGYRVILSRHVIEHHAYSAGFANSFRHRLRWNRSSRFSRPAGYLGQGFTYGLGWALLLSVVLPVYWSLALLAVSLMVRFWLAWVLGKQLLGDSTVPQRLWLVPLQDLLSLATWLGGFSGREILWRNQRYQLLPGGRFKLLNRG